MSSDMPTKEDLPKELQRILNTLTEDAQRAAIRKSTELAYDPNKGRISLEETLINLTQARDILLDAIEKGKSAQLPLKLQYALYGQVLAVDRELRELLDGKDAILNLESAVEELNSSVWQFRLHDLSDQVLGFHSKMNQLKSQETAIRKGVRAAEEFDTLRANAERTLESISDRAKLIAEEHSSATKVVEQLQVALRESTETGQKVSNLGAQVAQHETTAVQQLASAKLATADTEAIAAKSKEMRLEIEASRVSLQDLTTRAEHLLASTENAAKAQRDAEATSHEEFVSTANTEMSTLRAKLDEAIDDLTETTRTNLESVTTSTGLRVTELVDSATANLAKTESTQQAKLTEQLQEFATASKETVDAFVTKSDASLSSGNDELKRLVAQLDELEGRIREAIERATGYTLFHAFQKRQMEIAKAKNGWALALGACVLLSLAASAFFIYSLQFVTEYNAAFYLKLSISIPLIYAIAFCNLQYSRERKLEEEYAFKSSVSISLDPYQKLVGGLVDKAQPEELAKYTAFIIESVNRVFTSPTDPVFEGSKSQKNYTETIIKAVGSVIKPLAQGLKR
ncbi:MAG: hypothetical protein HOP16_03580 [Acidobacteria bacterium]|nr:hypothetical protein [Acidobacteriota bacterium]